MICHDLHAKICEFFQNFISKNFYVLKRWGKEEYRRKENFNTPFLWKTYVYTDKTVSPVQNRNHIVQLLNCYELNRSYLEETMFVNSLFVPMWSFSRETVNPRLHWFWLPWSIMLWTYNMNRREVKSRFSMFCAMS